MQRLGHKAYLVLKNKIFKGFYHIWAWRSSWSRTATILAIFNSPAPRRLPKKFEQHWPSNFRREVVWNSQHFPHSNVWGKYKCIGKQTWPCRKKVKRQRMIIVLATLSDLPSPIICAKIQHQGVLEKFLKIFYHMWAWRLSWSTDRHHFSNLLFPRPKEAPYEIWAKQAERIRMRSRLKSVNGRTVAQTDRRVDDRQKSDHHSSSWA